MQRFGSCLGVGAMLFALFTAPLFHFHDRDDHGHPVSLVHAHFIEFEGSDLHSDNEIEAPHPHDHARWVEFFTFNVAPSGFDLAIDFAETLALPLLEEREDIVISGVPRAHSPPGARRSAPRSPPTV